MKQTIDIISHREIKRFLDRIVERSQVGHAYLFYGPAHMGKTAMARYFALKLFCPRYEDKCSRQVLQGVHPDLIQIRKEEAKAKISIKQIRELKQKINLSTLYAPYKVAIIEEAETLSLAAANSFLKLFEEPPARTVIILLANDLSRIPWTLRSRAQIVHFSLPDKNEVLAYLKNKFDLPEAEVSSALQAALYRPELAVDFLENPENLGLHQEQTRRVIRLLDQGKLTAEEIAVPFWFQVVRDLLLVKLGLSPSNQQFRAELEELAEKYDRQQLLNLAESVLTTNYYLLHNVNRNLVWENLLLNCLKL